MRVPRRALLGLAAEGPEIDDAALTADRPPFLERPLAGRGEEPRDRRATTLRPDPSTDAHSEFEHFPGSRRVDPGPVRKRSAEDLLDEAMRRPPGLHQGPRLYGAEPVDPRKIPLRSPEDANLERGRTTMEERTGVSRFR